MGNQPQICGVLSSFAPSSLPGGLQGGTRGTLRAIAGCKVLPGTCCLFLAPGTTVTCSDPCLGQALDQFPHHCGLGIQLTPNPQEKICILHFLNPNPSFPSPQPALGTVGFWHLPVSPCWQLPHHGLSQFLGQVWPGLGAPGWGRRGLTLAGGSQSLPRALGKGTAGGAGPGTTIPMGFKRPQGTVGMRDRLSQLTMRLPVLLAALVAVATCTETFVG